MKWTDLTPVLIALLSLAGVVWQSRRTRYDGRDRLKRDIELLAMMPDDLEGKSRYREHVDASISTLIEDEDVRSRDWVGISMGLTLLAIAVVLAWVGVGNGGWWHLLTVTAGFIVFAAVVCLSISAGKHRRDERGRVISRTQP
ncbi:hypothetical protein [Streptomyces lydicus]|uniref:hypothetical protein n=1 Tax=Streptomyces lydicus TaxID=47763 RepID=UPI0005253757|nr:hypothetical protein [Streptomyces lydicus]MDC7338553.1 hypothetical protein [Streptomyces lydicus]UEG91999.1 hypothetical protein LJ741_16425 [Streptomyces lydicus]